jgi:starvation-inducible outer membrane lipoprotein
MHNASMATTFFAVVFLQTACHSIPVNISHSACHSHQNLYSPTIEIQQRRYSMDIQMAQHIMGKFSINHNTETFMETIELMDHFLQRGTLTDIEKQAYFLIIDEYAAYYTAE